MTPAEAWAGWMAMTWGERCQFMRTCVEAGILTPTEANKLTTVAANVASRRIH